MNQTVDTVRGNDLSPTQQNFVKFWSQEYFGDIAVTRDLDKAPVHWRLFLSDEDAIVSHVAVTELCIEVDDREQTAGAVGGLITARHLMGRGFGNLLMD